MNSLFDFVLEYSYTDSKLALIFMFLALFVCSYLLGSLNFGVILSRKMVKDDVRNHGSGNAGATNMLRSYGKKYAVMTILGDMFKVAVAILVSFLILFGSNCFDLIFGEHSFNENIILLKSLFGFFCVLGHIFPCFFEFKGGKGVATCGGMVFMIDYRIALILLAIFFVVLITSKMVSLGSLTMAAFYPVFIYIFHKNAYCLVVAIIFALIVFISHRENIVKIIKGKESNFSFKKSK